MSEPFVGGTALKRRTPTVEGGLVEVGGELFYRIVNYDAMPPFLMSLVSDSDHWMFISSNGALTAGRRDPDHALFPYCTDDRIHDSQDQTGGKTILLVSPRRGKVALWEPFSQRYEGLYRVTRNLSKSVYGNKLIFEEVNHDLGAVLFLRVDDQRPLRFRAARRLGQPGPGAGRRRSCWMASRTSCRTASHAGSRWSTARWPTATRKTSSILPPASASSSSARSQPTGPSPTRRCV